MKLKEYLKGLEARLVSGSLETEITEAVFDSRKVSAGCLFVCVKGLKFDAHEAAAEAAGKGAAAIVAERMVELPEGCKTALVLVPDTRYAGAFIAAADAGHPADRLTTIGVTGTKGKTTTTYLIKSILEEAGHKVGLIGTIEVIIGDRHIPAGHTTPEAYTIQKYFREMTEQGIDIVVMEASSQGFMLHRTEGFVFDYGVFTNIEPDHIGPGEHKDFQDYLECKAKLFKQCRIGILNGDDPHVSAVLKEHTCEVETFGLGEGCDLRGTALSLEKTPGLLGVRFSLEGALSFSTGIPMPGKFSVYNALAAIAVCRHFTDSPQVIGEGLKKAVVRGRVEIVRIPKKLTLLIDYAHNAMALESLLTTFKAYHPKRLVCLFGCGGNRSKLRRYEMGEVSGRLADLTIITSDNPRDEEPMDIIADIRTGMEKTDGKYVEIPDRKEAIRYAICNGQEGDIVILAGKGHEDYQEIKGVKHPMDERVLIREILEEEHLTGPEEAAAHGA